MTKARGAPLSILRALLLTGLALAGALAITQSPLGDKIEQTLSDQRLRHLGREGMADAVVVVAIDERALDVLGPWPWPRSRLGQFIERLGVNHQPAGIVLDMVLPPEAPQAEDAALAKVLSRTDLPLVIVGQLLQDSPRQKGVYRPVSMLGEQPTSRVYAGHLGVSPGLADAVMGIGHINAIIDADGSVRRTAPLLCTEQGCSLNLGLTYLSHMLGDPPWTLERGSIWQAAWRLNPVGGDAMGIPLGEDLTLTIPWRATSPHVYVSAADVWTGQLAPGLLKNRIVLVGGYALGIGDRIQGPFGQAPGVEAHARFTAALMAGTFTFIPRHALGWLALVVAAQTVLVLVLRKRRWLQLAIGLGAPLVWLLLNAALYRAEWELPVSFPFLYPPLLVMLLLLAHMGISRRALQRGLEAYLPAPLVVRLARGEEPDREVGWTTVLYADIVGYSVVSRGMDPEKVAQWGNTGVDLAISQIEAHGGHIDNIAGDGLLVYWREGSPREQAEQAIEAAASIRRHLPILNHELQSQGMPPLDMGIGLHAGPLIVGSFGRKKRRYTVLGEVANIAHRIERQTRRLPHRLLLSADVARTQQRYLTHSLGTYNLIEGDSGIELHWVDLAALPQQSEQGVTLL